LLYEPCSLAWMGSPMRREGHALSLWRSHPCLSNHARSSEDSPGRAMLFHALPIWCSVGTAPLVSRSMLAGLDGLTDEERGPCPLSVVQPPLLVEPCSELGGLARESHALPIWCSAGAAPLVRRSMLAGLDGLTDEERAMLSIWVPARRLVWIASTGFPHYLICRGICMRATFSSLGRREESRTRS
jgi:hypothetical protein